MKEKLNVNPGNFFPISPGNAPARIFFPVSITNDFALNFSRAVFPCPKPWLCLITPPNCIVAEFFPRISRRFPAGFYWPLMFLSARFPASPRFPAPARIFAEIFFPASPRMHADWPGFTVIFPGCFPRPFRDCRRLSLLGSSPISPPPRGGPRRSPARFPPWPRRSPPFSWPRIPHESLFLLLIAFFFLFLFFRDPALILLRRPLRSKATYPFQGYSAFPLRTTLRKIISVFFNCTPRPFGTRGHYSLNPEYRFPSLLTKCRWLDLSLFPAAVHPSFSPSHGSHYASLLIVSRFCGFFLPNPRSYSLNCQVFSTLSSSGSPYRALAFQSGNVPGYHWLKISALVFYRALAVQSGNAPGYRWFLIIPSSPIGRLLSYQAAPWVAIGSKTARCPSIGRRLSYPATHRATPSSSSSRHPPSGASLPIRQRLRASMLAIMQLYSFLLIFSLVRALIHAMAIMNLLKASYTGALGETVGSSWKGKAVVKKKIFAKSPPSALQTRAVRAFECLNRIASATAKLGAYLLFLDTSEQLPHNAIASWWKPAIRDKIFNPANISEVIPQDGAAHIRQFIYNRETERFSISVVVPNQDSLARNSRLFILAFDAVGKGIVRILTRARDYSTNFPGAYVPGQVLYLMAFIVEPNGKKPIIHGFTLKKGLNMRYSLEEFDTGDVWIDGKPIYQKTIRTNIDVPALSSQYANIAHLLDPVLSSAYIDFPVSMDVIYFNSESQAEQIRGAPNSLGVNCSISTTGLYAVVRSYNAQVSGIVLSIPITITIRYTKK